jgi:DNA-binding XRE family transcriptional regulator
MKRGITPDDAFREHMRDARDRAGLTQDQLARKLQDRFGLKIKRQGVIAIERGQRRVTLGEALCICHALDIAPVFAFTPWEETDPADRGAAGLGTTWLQVGEDHIPPKLAREWICGKRPADALGPEEGTRFFYSNAAPPQRESYDRAREKAREHAKAGGELPGAFYTPPFWILRDDKGEENDK